jgi:hypothetical protein
MRNFSTLIESIIFYEWKDFFRFFAIEANFCGESIFYGKEIKDGHSVGGIFN